MSNIFSTVEVLSTPRSKQKMRFKHLTTYGYSKLYPCFAFDCVPSDTVKIKMASVLKALPMVAPNMTRSKYTVHFWFVPYRLLDDNFTKGVRGFNDDGSSFSYEFPVWTPSPTGLIGSLWDYFGLPINVKESNGQLVEDATYVDGVEPTAYLKRAYNLVFNTMYRNENTTSEVSLDSTSLQYRCWRADYFTKALPLPQKPYDLDSIFGLPYQLTNLDNDVSLFNIAVSNKGQIDNTNSQVKLLSGSWLTSGSRANVYKSYKIGNSGVIGSPLTALINNSGGGTYDVTASADDDDFSLKSVVHHNKFAEDFNAHYQVTGFDQSDFRLWMQLQKWAERSNRAGSSRYDEYIQVHFGIKPQDARLQLPEFLGGIKTTIAVADEFAQAGYTIGEESFAQGNRIGIGGGALADKIRAYTAQEFGIIIGIASILPDAEYMQGVDREWIKHDSLDWFRHEFCCLSDQAVYNGELCVSNGKYYTNESHTTTGTLTADERKVYNKGTFGYQGIYDYMRFKMNKISGRMRTLFSYWHMARTFDATGETDKSSQVKLNQNFVEARDVPLRPFVLQKENGTDVADCYYVKNIFEITAYRPCTQRAIPGYADHF